MRFSKPIRRQLNIESLEQRQMFSASLDNVPRSYQSPIDTIRTPQFVSLGWDDNTDPAGIDWVVKAFGDRTDAHGNPILTSFYMNSVGFGPAAPTAADVPPGQSEGSGLDLGATPADLVNAFKTIPAAGHEVGNHTFDHHAKVLADKGGWDGMVQFLSNQATVEDWTKFLVDCNAALADPGGQDLSEVTGYRSPFLEYGKNLFPALSRMGFTYDCSIEAISNDTKQFPFPYTLDTGSVDHAASWKANPDNPNSFQVPNTPGLWEVPAYALRIPDGVEEQAYGLVDIGAKIRAGWSSIQPTDVHVTGFDYNVFLGQVDGQGKKTGPGLTGAEVLGLLKYNLDIRLAGNRAPFCFGTHSQYYLENWISANAPHVTVAEMRQTITDFLDYARSKPEVRIVSGQQIVDWMRNPTAIDDRPQILAPVPVASQVTINQPRVTLGNLFTGATTQARVNDGPWTRINVSSAGVAPLIGLRQGANTAVFRQISTDGMPSANQSVKIRFDSIAPPQPLVALRRSGPGGLTNDPALRVGRVETDARIEYSINGGAWSDVYAPADGPTVVRIRTVDNAGNTSRPSTPARFTLDRVAAAPAVALRVDSGQPDDRITTDGRLRVTGVEPGAKVEYSTDDGRTWRGAFSAVAGPNEILVRQRDRARNVSDATVFTFTKTGLLGANYSNNPAVVYSQLEPRRDFLEETYRGGSQDGIKGWIVNRTDRPVLVVDKNNPKSSQAAPSAWVIQPGRNLFFYRNTAMPEKRGLQSAYGVRFEISDFRTAVPQVSELELRDPFTGKPDTIYSSTWGGSDRVDTIRDDWSEGSVHEEHAGSHSLKIQRLNDGKLPSDGKNQDITDWAVFVVEVRRTF